MSMSRPQFDQRQYANSQQHQAAGVVVNGGLIDFQDNSHRGVAAEYHSAQLQAFQNQGMLPMASPATLSPGMFISSPGFMPGHPSPATLQQGLNVSGMSSPPQVGGACFTGPPTFLHLHGVTYRPVDSSCDSLMAAPSTQPLLVNDQSSLSTSNTQQQSVNTSSSLPAGSNAKILSETELNQMVEDRVASKVESYLSSRVGRSRSHHHHSSSNPDEQGTAAPARERSSSGNGQHRARSSNTDSGSNSAPRASSGSSRKTSANNEEEAYAVQRVRTANASMVTRPSDNSMRWARPQQSGMAW